MRMARGTCLHCLSIMQENAECAMLEGYSFNRKERGAEIIEQK